ncbi:MAG: hypothetical protein AB1403_13250 [Candidatus Riflebacteria bacterium]
MNILPPNPVAAGVASAPCHEALSRERIGELEKIEEVSTRFLGWINNGSDPVGQLHLGVVHLDEVQHPVSGHFPVDGELFP